MPSPEDRSEERSRECENPFISFRRYVDEQMAAFVAPMLQSFLGIPSVFNTQWPTTNEEAHRRIMESLGILSSPQEESLEKLQTREGLNQGNGNHSACDSQTNSRPSTCPYRPFSVSKTEDSEFYDPFLPRQSWLTNFLKHSTYSPLSLEKDEALRNHNVQWRRAFEDLMDAQSGKPMGSYDRGLNEREWIEASVNRWANIYPLFRAEWGLAERIREKMLQEIHGDADRTICATKAPENDASQETELDMYEQMLRMNDGAVGSRPGGNARPRERSEPQATGVVSTLTTTETVRLPDGSVTTKKVLRKRFADGREESNETVHTTQASQEQRSLQRLSEEEKPSDNDHQRNQGGDKKSGWFWS